MFNNFKNKKAVKTAFTIFMLFFYLCTLKYFHALYFTLPDYKSKSFRGMTYFFIKALSGLVGMSRPMITFSLSPFK